MSIGGPGDGGGERTGWGSRPPFLRPPSPCGSECCIRGPGPLEPFPTGPSLSPPLEGLGQADPRAVPPSEKQVPAGSSLTFSRQRAEPAPAQALGGKQWVCSAGGPRVLALEPLSGLPQPGDHGRRLASPGPSVSAGQDACGDARGLGLQRLRGVGRCDRGLGFST